jgi:hypothetical protein
VCLGRKEGENFRNKGRSKWKEQKNMIWEKFGEFFLFSMIQNHFNLEELQNCIEEEFI